MKNSEVIHNYLGRLPPGWEVDDLKTLCNYLQRGQAPTYVEESEIRVLNQRAIRWGKIEEGNLKFHDPDVPVKEDYMIRAGDVVLNSTGDITIGRAYLFQATPDPLFADSHVTIIRTNPKKLKPDFLVNLLATPQYQDLIYSLVTGSTGQLEFNRSNIEKLPIIHPSIDIQESLTSLWAPLYESITLSESLKSECENAIRLIFEREVLDKWKESYWMEASDIDIPIQH